MNVAKKDRQLKLIVNEKMNDKTEGTFGLIHSGVFFLYLKHEKTAVEASNRLDAMFFSSLDSIERRRIFELTRIQFDASVSIIFEIDTLGQ